MRVTLRLYDSATRSQREFVPLEPGKASIYLCGATVQAPPPKVAPVQVQEAPPKPVIDQAAALQIARQLLAALSSRQTDVLALVVRGQSNKAICRALALAEPTVKNHVTAILKALGVSNRTEAVIAVGELGWKLQPIPQ